MQHFHWLMTISLPNVSSGNKSSTYFLGTVANGRRTTAGKKQPFRCITTHDKHSKWTLFTTNWKEEQDPKTEVKSQPKESSVTCKSINSTKPKAPKSKQNPEQRITMQEKAARPPTEHGSLHALQRVPAPTRGACRAVRAYILTTHPPIPGDVVT